MSMKNISRAVTIDVHLQSPWHTHNQNPTTYYTHRQAQNPHTDAYAHTHRRIIYTEVDASIVSVVIVFFRGTQMLSVT